MNDLPARTADPTATVDKKKQRPEVQIAAFMSRNALITVLEWVYKYVLVLGELAWADHHNSLT